jgi:UDP-glucose 4-epimerase
LVTGGCGFIGSTLVRKLLKLKKKVIVLDNLVNGHLKFLPEHLNLIVIKGDITNSDDIKTCLEYIPDSVIHLAAHHFIPFCNANPSEAVRVNIYGTQNLLECISKRKSIEKFIFASTAAVYAPSDKMCREGDRLDPIDIYGITKKTGEEIINLFSKATGIPSYNARLFNAIGPRETNPHLLPDILKEIQLGNTTICLGNLVPKRDYIYVNDISDGIITLLVCNAESGSYNIGSGHAYSPKEMVAKISKIMNKKLDIKSVPEKQRRSDRPYLSSNSQKLAELGWKCQYNTYEALKETLLYYKVI